MEIVEYRQLVQRLYGFYAPLDGAVAAAIDASDSKLAGHEYVRRSGLLAQDLLDLGFDQNAIKNSPRCDRILDVVAPETLGGVLYVVEGATMGGSIIEKALAKTMGTGNAKGRRYWRWCRDEGAEGWSHLNAYLDGLEVTDRTVENQLKGASGTFRIFADWLEPLNHAETSPSDVFV